MAVRALKAKTWLSHILKSSMNTVLFVNATIGFFENRFSSFIRGWNVDLQGRLFLAS